MVQWPLVMWACNGLVVVGWTALLLAPLAHQWCWLAARTCAMSLAVIWAMLAVSAFGPGIPAQLWQSVWPTVMMGSLSVAELALLQFQVFNLFVASWQVEDGPHHKIPHIWLLPGLIGTALVGPFGLMIHMAIRDMFKLRLKRQTAHAGQE
jgi:hypothetical protein